MRVRSCQKFFCTWSRHLYYLRQISCTAGRSSRFKLPHRPLNFQKCSPYLLQQHGYRSSFLSETDIVHGSADTVKDGSVDPFEIHFDYDHNDVDGDDYDDFDFGVDSDEDFEHEDFSDLPGPEYRGQSRDVSKLPAEHWKKLTKLPDSPRDSRILRVSIIGTPNAGKSTLINSLMGWKLNGVSIKAHTTDKNVLSVFTEGNTQIVFIDTPGVMTPEIRKRHHCAKEMLEAPEKSILDADIIGIIIDCSTIWERKFHEKVLQILHENSEKPSFLILNKTDLLFDPSITLSVTRRLTNGIVGGKDFGRSTTEHRKVLNTNEMQLDEEGFNQLFSELEKKYGKLESVKQLVDNTSDSVGQSFQEKETEGEVVNKNNEAVEDVLTKLSEDSYQRDFLERIMGKNIHSGNDLENKESVRTGTDTTKEIVSREVSHSPVVNSESERMGKEAEKKTQTTEGSHTSVQIGAAKLKEQERRRLEFKKNPFWTKFDSVFPVSALTGDGIGYIVEFLQDKAKSGPWLYHSSVLTDQDPRDIAKKCVRQALLTHVQGAVPFLLDIEIIYWEVNNGRLDMVIEVTCQNTYEMGLLLASPDIQARGLHVNPKRASDVQTEKSKKLASILKQQFLTKTSNMAKISSDAKQALLDAFRCEIKFKLAVRLDKRVARSPRKKNEKRRKLERVHGQNYKFFSK